MSNPTEFVISNNNFESGATNFIKQIFTDRNFTDVTLACSDDTYIKAHKVILSSKTSFFHNMFLANPHQHPLIYIRGLEPANLKSIIEFIYLGQTMVKSDNLGSFLAAAAELKVEGLTETELGGKKEEPTKEEANDEPTKEKSSEQCDNAKVVEKSDHLDQYDHEEEIIEDICSQTKAYACDICKVELSSSYSIKRHKRRVHDSAVTEDKAVITEKIIKQEIAFTTNTFPCDQCDYTTSKQKYLKAHISTHEESKPHQCKFCDHSTRRPTDLRKHVERKHPEEDSRL